MTNTSAIECPGMEPIFYLPSDDFTELCEDELLYLPQGESIYSESQNSKAASEGGDYQTLRGLPLLSPAGERFLFRKMNFLRYQAEQIRSSKKQSEEASSEIQMLLEDAEAVRNMIAECNLRLVISISRKFSTAACEFDELMSEGNEILLKAIGKFDFSRGFRFSTYATHSVQRHFYRYTQRKTKRDTVEYRSSVEILNELPSAAEDELINQWVREEQRMTQLISRMAERLDEREQQIVTSRFGLGGDSPAKTLRELSAEMGLSKERIRQLQIIAVEKLRDLFDELDPETFVMQAG